MILRSRKRADFLRVRVVLNAIICIILLSISILPWSVPDLTPSERHPLVGDQCGAMGPGGQPISKIKSLYFIKLLKADPKIK